MELFNALQETPGNHKHYAHALFDLTILKNTVFELALFYVDFGSGTPRLSALLRGKNMGCEAEVVFQFSSWSRAKDANCADMLLSTLIRPEFCMEILKPLAVHLSATDPSAVDVEEYFESMRLASGLASAVNSAMGQRTQDY